MQKPKGIVVNEEYGRIVNRWMEFYHILRQIRAAFNEADYEYVAKRQNITPKIHDAVNRYIAWCTKYYGKKA